jgi:hypothetical protein
MFWRKFLSKPTIPTAKIDYDFYFNTDQHGDIKLSVLNLGNLNVTSGQIVACDPLVNLGETSPFARKIPAGLYPVKVAVAETPDMGERYALARLELSAKSAVRWELAVTRAVESKVSTLKDDEYFGFPVDAGLGCFCDHQAQQAYAKFSADFMANNPESNMYDDYFAAEFKKNAINHGDPDDIGDWLNYTVPNTSNNVIMFHSGFGDGYYPCYWGLDKDGQLTALVIDFQVFG